MDYIYGAADLAELKGHKYSKKRNLLSQFQKQVREKCAVLVEPITQANSSRCMSLLEEWKPSPESEDGQGLLDCERKAIFNGLRSFEQLGMRGITVSIEGRLSGFALGCPLSGDTFILNFEKALDGVKGLYQFLDNEFARSLPQQYTFINKESDLGKPGLAKAKESYYPCRKVRSYILTLKAR
ncbi:MAG TPA: phosphatidylglycerol lysyltransferase domain-containing protein, partial [Elusimicrobiales bacterium]|nr:phosphatidylglycerol lysyltransferase domain-containing protein [Elusimicrobiales bacterium]